MIWPPGTDEAIIRDGCCVVAGGMMGLAPHHIKSEGSGGSDDLSNKVTLCYIHHKQAHNGYLVLEECTERAMSYERGLEILTHRDEIDRYLRGKILLE